ncbi:MAG: beta-lactamase family protein [Acetatifactor sp.]
MENATNCPISQSSISPLVLTDLLDHLRQTHIPMHSLHIVLSGHTELEAYYAPCQKGQLHRMFSVSKNLTALAVLKLCETGFLALDDPICRYFPEYVNRDTHPWIMMTTVRNMLMMRSCHASTTYKFDMSQDWVESFFTVRPTHKPGTVFHYDTSSTHTLCALAEKLSGRPMLDYLKDVMLREMGWSEESYMLTDPFGHSMGGSGLMATSEDLVLLGRFLMQEGSWNGKELLRKDLLAQALAWQSATAVTGPIPAECQGYGYSFWRGEHDALVCYGMGGQLILCYPTLELLVVTTADTQGMQGANQMLYDAVHRFLLPRLQDGTGKSGVSEDDRQKLQERIARLRMEPISHTFSQSCSPSLRNSILSLRNGNSSRGGSLSLHSDSPLAQGGTEPADRLSREGSFLDSRTDGPRIRGTVYRIQGDSPFTELCLELASGSGTLCYTLGDVSCRLPFGLDEVIPCRFPVYDMFCASSGMWLDEHTFYIRTHLLDTSVGSIHFQLYFGEDDVTVFMKKQEENLFAEYSGHLYGLQTPGQDSHD